jgi:hypothetical protein
MYMFSRQVRLTGHRMPEAIAMAHQISDHATQIIGFPMNLWTRAFSPNALSIAFTAMVPDLATLEAATDKLNVDGPFQDQVEKAMQYVVPGAMDDHLDMVVHPTETTPPASSRLPAYAGVTTSTIIDGQMLRGITIGVELAQTAERVMGVPVTFLAGDTGNYGGTAWLIQFDDINAVQRGNEALTMSAEFAAIVERAAQVFSSTPGGTTTTLYRRVV